MTDINPQHWWLGQTGNYDEGTKEVYVMQGLETELCRFPFRPGVPLPLVAIHQLIDAHNASHP